MHGKFWQVGKSRISFDLWNHKWTYFQFCVLLFANNQNFIKGIISISTGPDTVYAGNHMDHPVATMFPLSP